jgi:hypothetical protein
MRARSRLEYSMKPLTRRNRPESCDVPSSDQLLRTRGDTVRTKRILKVIRHIFVKPLFTAGNAYVAQRNNLFVRRVETVIELDKGEQAMRGVHDTFLGAC